MKSLGKEEQKSEEIAGRVTGMILDGQNSQFLKGLCANKKNFFVLVSEALNLLGNQWLILLLFILLTNNFKNDVVTCFQISRYSNLKLNLRDALLNDWLQFSLDVWYVHFGRTPLIMALACLVIPPI